MQTRRVSGSEWALSLSMNVVLIQPYISSGGHRRSATNPSTRDTTQRIVLATIGHVLGANDDHADVQDASLVAAQVSFDPVADTDADAAELVSREIYDVSQ